MVKLTSTWPPLNKGGTIDQNVCEEEGEHLTSPPTASKTSVIDTVSLNSSATDDDDGHGSGHSCPSPQVDSIHPTTSNVDRILS